MDYDSTHRTDTIKVKKIGELLLFLLGRSRHVSEECVSEVADFFKERPTILPISQEISLYEFKAAGIQLIFDEQSGRFNWLHFITLTTADYLAYQYDLPNGVSKDDTKAEVEAKLVKTPDRIDLNRIAFYEEGPITFTYHFDDNGLVLKMVAVCFQGQTKIGSRQ